MCQFREFFPNLSDENLHPDVSPQDSTYNGIAYSVSRREKDRYWWPDALGDYYWPSSIPREETTEAFLTMYSSLNYKHCKSSELEEGIEKVAIYVDATGTPTHAARQAEDGYWESKIIHAEDIRHATPQCLEGEIFGKVWMILCRRRT